MNAMADCMDGVGSTWMRAAIRRHARQNPMSTSVDDSKWTREPKKGKQGKEERKEQPHACKG
jgi:hypothetical protein